LAMLCSVSLPSPPIAVPAVRSIVSPLDGVVPATALDQIAVLAALEGVVAALAVELEERARAVVRRACTEAPWALMVLLPAPAESW